ncbi:Secreted protein [Salmonella bongori]|nr:Secreted protein [Salmonella bongori]
MPVTLHFGNQQNYMLNETRLAQLLSADKEKATHRGYWNKLQDHFTSEKTGSCPGSVTRHALRTRS